MIHKLFAPVAAALVLSLAACDDKGAARSTSSSSGAAPQAQPEAPITKDNLNAELDKLDGEIGAEAK